MSDASKTCGSSHLCFQHVRGYLNELIESQNILKSLVVKNLFGRYKNSFLGFAWHFIMPIVMMVVYYIVFTTIRSGNLPNYWVFLASGIFPFNFMLSNLIGGSSSIINNGSMIKKMYFPREIIVYSQVVSSFIVLLIGYSIVLSVVIISGYDCNILSLLFLPIIMITMLFFVTGYSLIFSALSVYVRDIQYILSSLSMVFYFMTPMYFMADTLTGVLSSIVWLNPFTYFIESFHAIVYMGELPETSIIIMCLVLSVVPFVLGHLIFIKLKRGFAERL